MSRKPSAVQSTKPAPSTVTVRSMECTTHLPGVAVLPYQTDTTIPAHALATALSMRGVIQVSPTPMQSTPTPDTTPEEI